MFLAVCIPAGMSGVGKAVACVQDSAWSDEDGQQGPHRPYLRTPGPETRGQRGLEKTHAWLLLLCSSSEPYLGPAGRIRQPANTEYLDRIISEDSEVPSGIPQDMSSVHGNMPQPAVLVTVPGCLGIDLEIGDIQNPGVVAWIPAIQKSWGDSMEIARDHEEVDRWLWLVDDRHAGVRDGGQEDHSAQTWYLGFLLL